MGFEICWSSGSVCVSRESSTCVPAQIYRFRNRAGVFRGFIGEFIEVKMHQNS